MKLVDGIWNVKGCIGNKLIKEINPMNMRGISKEKIVNQIKNLINNYYIFMGYGQFANYIIKTIHYEEEVRRQEQVNDELKGKNKSQMLGDVKITLNKRIIRKHI